MLVDVQAFATIQLPPHAAAIVGISQLQIRGFVDDQSVFGPARAAGEYEPPVMDVIADKLSPGGVFVDVGANIGILSALAAARIGPQGTVLAIEASPITCRLLVDNLNQAGSQQCKVLNRGVWDEPRKLIISHIVQGPGWSFVSPEQGPDGIAFVVEGDTLDALLAQAGVAHVDLLKVDVEGAETKVLRGAHNLLTTNHPAIVLEINPHTLWRCSANGVQELYQCIRDYSYDMRVIARSGGLAPVTDYADLENWFKQGHTLVDVLCE